MKVDIKGFFPSFLKLLKTIFPLILLMAFIEVKSNNLPVSSFFGEVILIFIPITLLSFFIWKIANYKSKKK